MSLLPSYRRLIRIAGWIALAVLAQAGNGHAVHDTFDRVRCLDCHERLPLQGRRAVLRDELSAACAVCHPELGHSHPVGVVPKVKVPPDMPLDTQGRVACVTCHTFHEGYRDDDGNRKFFLRKIRGRAFCRTCHGKL